MRRVLRPARIFVLWGAIGVGAGILLAIAAPLVFDARPLTVLSGSMEPTLRTGDVVVAKRIAPADVRIGDVVTYRAPKGQLITHRVRGMHRSGERFVFVTKGDANNSTERWTMQAGDELSRSVYRVPMAGHVLSETGSRGGKLLLIALPLLLLAAWEIKRIWRPGEVAA